jgi:hypothetical protein
MKSLVRHPSSVQPVTTGLAAAFFPSISSLVVARNEWSGMLNETYVYFATCLTEAYALAIFITLLFGAFQSRMALNTSYVLSTITSIICVLALTSALQYMSEVNRRGMEYIVYLSPLSFALLCFTWLAPIAQYRGLLCVQPFSIKRLFGGTMLFAIGFVVGTWGVWGKGVPAPGDEWTAGVFWVVGGAMMGAGLFAPFRRTAYGMAIGLVVHGALLVLIYLISLQFHSSNSHSHYEHTRANSKPTYRCQCFIPALFH